MESPRFPSLVALRSVHRELLTRERSGNAPDLAGQLTHFIARAKATGQLLDSEDDRRSIQSLLDYWASILVRANEELPDAILADFDPELAPELDDSACPYVGLDSFRGEDTDRFFGRQR